MAKEATVAACISSEQLTHIDEFRAHRRWSRSKWIAWAIELAIEEEQALEKRGDGKAKARSRKAA
jgi:metal-responsive CopG/Arc/MetJ family transcriptional regulator